MFKSRSPRQIDHTKENLWVIQEREQLRQMHEAENGSCKNCAKDLKINNPVCSDCVIMGGPLKLFEDRRSKEWKKKRKLLTRSSGSTET